MWGVTAVDKYGCLRHPRCTDRNITLSVVFVVVVFLLFFFFFFGLTVK